MALLNEDKKYIVVKQNGVYEVYPSKKARDAYKNAPKPEDIVKKYKELIKKETFNVLKIKRTEDGEQIENAQKHLDDLVAEYQIYIGDLNRFNGTKHKFPIISEYFENVKDSIPKIIEMGIINLKGVTVQEKYEYAKEVKRFGETKDI